MKQLELFPTLRQPIQPMSTAVQPWGFPVEVFYEFDEGEPPAWDHPGCEPYVVVEAAKIGGVDVYDMLTNEQIERLEDYVLRAMGVR